MRGYEFLYKLVSKLKEREVQDVYLEACKNKQGWVQVADVLSQYKFCITRHSSYSEEIVVFREFLETFFAKQDLLKLEDRYESRCLCK